MAEKSNRTLIYVIVAVVGLLVAIPLCVVFGSAAAGFVFYQRTAESVAQTRDVAEQQAERATEEHERAAQAQEAARAAAIDQAGPGTEVPAVAPQAPGAPDPLGLEGL